MEMQAGVLQRHPGELRVGGTEIIPETGCSTESQIGQEFPGLPHVNMDVSDVS